MAVDAVAVATSADKKLAKQLQDKIDELSAFVKGEGKGKGKSKDKGKNPGYGGKGGYGGPQAKAKPKTPCPICNKPGHWKADCWYNPDKAIVQSGKGAAPGGGKQGGKGAGKGKCWTCHKAGHVAANCPDKALHTLEEPQEPEPLASLGSVLMINSLETDHPELAQSSYKVRTGVDSGAAVSVWTRKTCTDYPATVDTLAGRSYKVASGAEIKDEGCRTVVAINNSALRGAQGRIANVHKNLTAVYDMMQAGHRIVFDLDSEGNDISHALHKESKMETPFIPTGRTWEMELEVVPYKIAQQFLGKQSKSSSSSSSVPLSPFSRQPRRV